MFNQLCLILLIAFAASEIAQKNLEVIEDNIESEVDGMKLENV